jgi:hypothetical protein
VASFGSGNLRDTRIGCRRLAGVPLGVGEFVARDAAHDFLSVVDDAAVLRAVAQRKANVLGPFVGLVVPLRALLTHGNRRARARDQALVDGDCGLRLAVVAAGEQESLAMAKIDDGNRVRFAIRGEFLRRSDLQCASTVDFHDARNIRGTQDGSEIGILHARRSDGRRRHALAVKDIRAWKTRDAGPDFLFDFGPLLGFMFAVEAHAQEEGPRGDGRNPGDPEKDFAKWFVIDREHKNSRRKNGSEYAGSESHGSSPFPDYSGLNNGEGGEAIIAERKRKQAQNFSVVFQIVHGVADD